MSKIAIVTGGTRGIGLAATKALIADGYKVAALYHGNDAAAKACQKETGARTYKLDVSDFKQCSETVMRIQKEMGTVSVLVNNAGITKDGMLHKMDVDDWHDVIKTNLDSAFYMCRAILPQMRDAKYGRIINISSINGQKGQLGQTNYSAAKAGLLGFTKALALESAPKQITVNAICPGYVETGMTEAMNQDILCAVVKQIPVGRMGSADEIAGVVSFLVSEKAGYITGATISVNGGQYMA